MNGAMDSEHQLEQQQASILNEHLHITLTSNLHLFKLHPAGG